MSSTLVVPESTGGVMIPADDCKNSGMIDLHAIRQFTHQARIGIYEESFTFRLRLVQAVGSDNPWSAVFALADSSKTRTSAFLATAILLSENMM